MSSAVACAEVQVIRPIEAVSTISRLAKVIGALIAWLTASATAGDAGRILLGQQHQRELVAGKARQRVARLQQPVQPPRDGEQDGVAGRDAEPVIDLLEAVDVDDEHGRLESSPRPWRARSCPPAGS